MIKKIHQAQHTINSLSGKNHSPAQFVIVFICLVIFGVLFGGLLAQKNARAVFFFPVSDVKKDNAIHTVSEIRYLPKKENATERLEQYISELLFGPINPEYLPLFDGNVRTLRCFVAGKNAYIDFSEEALAPVYGKVPVDKTFEIFKKNVFTNFRNIDTIYMYIDGKEVYTKNPFGGAM
ncbi:GerMN domain-containing protein [Brucepastera parasyntrophica]|uniref:GerMN domain-containing protein n=1 Tax=Brucepastera parasyntrophica TaxID=2880008 RepID=UPI00210EEB8D|nr:GerMN domain-containing protein [Brucepastera parasyntrophica]ULQ60131.1 GerMN domain-containing protein [Brucepastera parasyntrophica]